jgi:hypothetical protein
MPITENIKYIHEPTDLQCGQAVIAMLCGVTVDEVITLTGTDRETDLKQMFAAMEHYDINFDRTRRQAEKKSDLPEIALLSLETPRCWHWSLYFKGTFFDPEHGVLNDFPTSNRKYYFEIKNSKV